MPEGHTVHRVAQDHQRWFTGQKMGVASPQGRFHEEAVVLNGSRLKSVTAHGKHLFYHWPGDRIVHVHLGLYGKFRVHENPSPEPRGAVRLRLIGRERTLDLNGPNRCQLIGRKQYRGILARLGEDPLQPEACPDNVWKRINSSRAAIGSLLLNQAVMAGVGNVYRAEILFLLGIDPMKSGSDLDREQFDDLWQLTVDLLQTGVKYNRIITAHRRTDGKAASRLKATERLNIYKKKNCPTCGSPVSRWELANRRIYACRTCQQ